jgi:hypothetical protein
MCVVVVSTQNCAPYPGPGKWQSCSRTASASSSTRASVCHCSIKVHMDRTELPGASWVTNRRPLIILASSTSGKLLLHVRADAERQSTRLGWVGGGGSSSASALGAADPSQLVCVCADDQPQRGKRRNSTACRRLCTPHTPLRSCPWPATSAHLTTHASGWPSLPAEPRGPHAALPAPWHTIATAATLQPRQLGTA